MKLILLVVGLTLLTASVGMTQPAPGSSISANAFASLNLTDSQTQAINAMFKEVNTRLHAIMSDPTLSKDDRIAKAKVLEQARFIALNKILTPEQQASLKVAQEQMRKALSQKPAQ